MTVRDALREGAAALAGSETPFLDASLLLGAELSMDRTELLASGPVELDAGTLAAFRRGLERRASGLPIAYILGYKEFYGRRFVVDQRVLIPRPDTETLVEASLRIGDALARSTPAALDQGEAILRDREERTREGCTAEGAESAEWIKREAGRDGIEIEENDSYAGYCSPAGVSDVDVFSSSHTPLRVQTLRYTSFRVLRGESIPRLRVLDLCTGSGCVAISIAAERPEWIVAGSDISAGALELARKNASALVDPSRPGGPVEFFEADLFGDLYPGWDLVVSNPPYVESGETERLLKRGWSEPRSALDGGPDGLDLIRRLVPQAAAALAPGGALAVEADSGQADRIAELFRASRFIHVRTASDLAGRPRVTEGRMTWSS